MGPMRHELEPRHLKVALVMPVLNEIAGLREILPRIRREWVQQILVIDGGSTDGTLEYALEHGCEVHRQQRAGLRLGYIEAYEKVEGDVVVTFSPDGNSIPELLPALIDKMREGHDMVIVSRYGGGARSHDDTPLTRLGNYVFTTAINLLFGGRYTDALVMYRAYRRLLPIELHITEERSEWYERLVGKYLGWEPQMAVRCAQRRLSVAEIPGDEPRRIGDEGKRRLFLPSTRIHHFRAALAFLFMLVDEFVRGLRQRRRAVGLPASKA